MRRIEHTPRYTLRDTPRARVDEASEHRRTESLEYCSSTCYESVTICCAWKIARPWSRNVTILVDSVLNEKWLRRSFPWTSNGLVDRRQRSFVEHPFCSFNILARIWNARWTSLIYPWRERIPSIETRRIAVGWKNTGTINSPVSGIW